MLTNFSFLGILKIFVLFGVGLYIVFAAVVVKQVQIMTGTVKVGLETPIKIISYLHFAFAILVFLFALVRL